MISLSFSFRSVSHISSNLCVSVKLKIPQRHYKYAHMKFARPNLFILMICEFFTVFKSTKCSVKRYSNCCCGYNQFHIKSLSISTKKKTKNESNGKLHDLLLLGNSSPNFSIDVNDLAHI